MSTTWTDPLAVPTGEREGSGGPGVLGSAAPSGSVVGGSEAESGGMIVASPLGWGAAEGAISEGLVDAVLAAGRLSRS
ncbi:MAG: hypothetical protein KKA97_10290, partial [Actinobacteria bacterium]|nr:hypothetical protein [Actinomycetota bacterium]